MARSATFALLAFLAGILSGQENPHREVLSGEAIIAKMVAMDRARMAELLEYTSTRRYVLENRRFHKTAETSVELRYFSPGRKEFAIISESGSSLIRKKVFRRMMDSELEASGAQKLEATRITPENYEFRPAGSDCDRGRRSHVFDISPKVENKFAMNGRVWVDAEDFAITRIEGRPAKNPSFWVRSTTFVHTYQKVGPFWLPLSNVSQTDTVGFGHTSVEIHYSDYRISAIKEP